MLTETGTLLQIVIGMAEPRLIDLASLLKRRHVTLASWLKQLKVLDYPDLLVRLKLLGIAPIAEKEFSEAISKSNPAKLASPAAAAVASTIEASVIELPIKKSKRGKKTFEK